MPYIKNIFLLVTIFLSFSTLNIASLTGCQEDKNIQRKLSTADNDTSIFKSIIPILLEKGVSQKFIDKYLKTSDTKARFNERYIKINVTGYLKKANYSYVYGEKAVKTAADFIEKYKVIFDTVEVKYNVPREVIAAILWTETRIGGYLGTHNIADVYFSTALVNQKEFIKVNTDVVDALDTTTDAKKELQQKIQQRSDKKHKWAINELVAMSKIEENYDIDFSKINGSWAGAFGLCQFLPSSYLKRAVDGDADGKIDLFNPADAIYSVANYLKYANWNTNFIKKQRAALFNYNNSNDYVDAILKLCDILYANKDNS